MSGGEGNALAEARGPAVLEYFPEAKRTHSSAAAYYVFIAPVFVGMAVNAAGFGELALPAIVASAVGMYLYRRYDRRTPHVTFEVNAGVLNLKGLGASAPTAIRLEDLYDVTLDTKTIQRVQENAGGFPELRFINSTVGPAIDTARIEFETSDGTIYLTEHRVSYLDSSEWANKIRRFLRRNGWVPEDERE